MDALKKIKKALQIVVMEHIVEVISYEIKNRCNGIGIGRIPGKTQGHCL